MRYQKLCIYVDEDDRVGKRPLYEEILRFLRKKGIRGATVFKGVFGWGPDGVVHTVRLLRATGNLPLKIEIIEREEVITALLPELKKILVKGLITISPVEEVIFAPGNGGSN